MGGRRPHWRPRSTLSPLAPLPVLPPAPQQLLPAPRELRLVRQPAGAAVWRAGAQGLELARLQGAGLAARVHAGKPARRPCPACPPPCRVSVGVRAWARQQAMAYCCPAAPHCCICMCALLALLLPWRCRRGTGHWISAVCGHACKCQMLGRTADDGARVALPCRRSWLPAGSGSSLTGSRIRWTSSPGSSTPCTWT